MIAALDDEVLAALNPDTFIRNKTLSVGRMDTTATENLVIVIKSGPLDIDVRLVEERTVGADLGDHYVPSGFWGAVVALLLGALFMILIYGFPGLLADVVVAVNIVLLLAVPGLAGVPLTLAGFAGLGLTIGISVDAAILIYERVREDYCQGYGFSRALASGLTRARATIIDTNMTILIAALMLFIPGSGPVRGFALTVTAGILTSLFTTLIFMLLLLESWTRRLHMRVICRPAFYG